MHVIPNCVNKSSAKRFVFNFYSLMQPGNLVHSLIWIRYSIHSLFICTTKWKPKHAKFSRFLFLAYTHRCTDHRRLSKYTKRKRSAFSVRCSFLNICARFILYIPGSFYQLVNCHYISRHGTHTHLYKSHFITAKRNCV